MDYLEDWEDVENPNLLDDEIRAQLPPLYSNEDKGLNALALVKFFMPDAGWTWYASDFDGEDTFYGIVIGAVAEPGYFQLSELEEIRGPHGLAVRRDKKFQRRTLREIKNYFLDEGRPL